MTLKNDIGWAIDQYRLAKNWSKKELAGLAEIDQGNLNRIISGKQEPTLEKMEAIARALNVTVAEIIMTAEHRHTGGDPWKAAFIQWVKDLSSEELRSAFRRSRNQDPEPPKTKPKARAAKKSST